MPTITAEKKGGDFKPIDPGTYVARCYSMIEIGTIETEFNGHKKKSHKVSIGWELPTETAVFNPDNGPEPYVVNKTYTLSMHEKSTLRKDLESWRGKKYTDAEAVAVDITKLISQPCLLTIVHDEKDGKTYANVTGITKLMKGQTCPQQVNKTRILAYDDFNWDLFESLSDYMKDKIRSSEEFRAMKEPATAAASTADDDIPDDEPPF